MRPADEGVAKKELPSVPGAVSGAFRGSNFAQETLGVEYEGACLGSEGPWILLSKPTQREVPGALFLAGTWMAELCFRVMI